jgi:diguanylate cyclase (GGDEF)-like protein
MKPLQRKILEQLIAGSGEPVVVAQVDSADWPVVLCNPAFEDIAGKKDIRTKPFADVVEQLVGRDIALDISELIRAGHESTLPVKVGGQHYLLVLEPLKSNGKDDSKFYAGYLRAGANGAGDVDVQQALLKAKRRIRNLSRDDSVTGFLNANAFRDVLDHDWAVARREKSSLALVAFTIDYVEEYREVFGRHATDTCMRRVAQTIRHCLKRASDVAARVDCEQGDKLIVLSHAAEEAGVIEFASRIATSVRNLGLHHPRSKAARFVTVSYKTVVKEAGADKANAAAFLQSVLD